ncbi:sugar transferase [uncultured Roseobacter sp.]|uniref:sugar transferase n=1 Tax=uncultured Roseobacter sp. TaxID=114847 RepID=UPI00263700BC|nr:sugar transferase [uncultured Roseobacter sp.]
MKLILTGASGFVGQLLVPRLTAAGATLLLAGRDKDRLASMFPEQKTCGYNELARLGKGFDQLVHLAVLNNNQPDDEAAFDAVNVDFMLDVLCRAREAKVGQFVNVSTVQVLDDRVDTPYARSKLKAQRQLAPKMDIAVSTLYLPLVYADRFTGRLSWLNALPAVVRRAFLPLVSACKPMVHADILSAHILAGSKAGIVSDGQNNNKVFQFSKRSIDLAFVLVVALFFWWLLIAIWLTIRLTSQGPGIFSQERIGQEGRIFICHKFRTMASGTKQAGTHEISSASVTRVGQILRRTKLDELPQIWNIVRGELSLVGPRPCLPTQDELIAARRARGVLTARPGISGLAQVEGIDMSTPQCLAARDADYIALQGLFLDLKIAILTIAGRGGGDRVAR